MSGAAPRLERSTRLLLLVAAGGAAAYLVVLLVMFALRIPHPYDIEWMEGLVVDHIARVRAGEALYVEPSIRFTPLIYPPLYYYVAAVATQLIGEGLLAPRLVSAAASLACFAILFVFGRRETGSTAAGLLAGGLYAAMFELGGGWFDLARIDNLFMMWLLWGAYLLRFATDARRWALAGGLVFLAALTKQSAIFVAAPLGLYLLLTKGLRPALVFGLAFGAPLLASVLLLHAATDGWHTFYVYTLPARHDIVPAYLRIFFEYDLARPLPLALVVLGLFLARSLLRLPAAEPAERDRSTFHLLFCFGMMGASAASRIHVGGADNVLLPAYAAVALPVAVGAALMAREAFGGWKRFLPTIVCLLVVLQLALLGFDPRRHLPSDEDVRAGDLFVDVIASIDGEVFTPDHGYLAARAGKHDYAHYVPLWDVIRGGPSEPRRLLMRDMARAIATREFAAILIHKTSRLTEDLSIPIQRHYREQGPALPRGFVFAPLGVRPGGAVMWVAR